MQTGYLMLNGGATQLPNVQNSMFSLIVCLTASTVCFWAVGYALSRGVSAESNQFIGQRGFALEMRQFVSEHDFVYHWGYLQVVVAIAGAGLLERGSVWAYLVLASLLGLIVFPTVSYWLWSADGWLSPDTAAPFLIALDYGGSGVVHVVGGTAALVASVLLGARKSVRRHRLASKQHAENAVQSSVDRDGDSVMHFVGSLAIWFGTYGVCQARLQRAESKFALAALVGPNIVLAAAFGGVVSAAFGAWARPRRKMRFITNGIVAGLAAISAGAPWQQPYSAMATGALAGIVYCASTVILERTPFDDTADAVAVHLFPGILGMMVAALFVDYRLVEQYFRDPNAPPATRLAILQQDQGRLFGAQLLAILCIVVWTAAMLALFLLPLRLFKQLRVSEEDEVRGLDPLIDPHAERVRRAIHITRTMPSNDLTTQQRQCGKCGLWLTGDVVHAGTKHYHVACFECAAHSEPLKLSETYALFGDQPLCTACAVFGRPARPMAAAAAAASGAVAANDKAGKKSSGSSADSKAPSSTSSTNNNNKKAAAADHDDDQENDDGEATYTYEYEYVDDDGNVVEKATDDDEDGEDEADSDEQEEEAEETEQEHEEEEEKEEEEEDTETQDAAEEDEQDDAETEEKDESTEEPAPAADKKHHHRHHKKSSGSSKSNKKSKK